MANQKKSTTKSNTKNSRSTKSTSKKSTTAKRSTTKNSSKNTTTKKSTKKEVTPKTSNISYSNNAVSEPTNSSSISIYDIMMKFRRSPFFAPISFLVVFLVVIGIDLLISWNNFGRFFKILGFEVIIIGLFWLLRRTIFTFNSSNRR